jgi:excisionase family DNA binding protein
VNVHPAHRSVSDDLRPEATTLLPSAEIVASLSGIAAALAADAPVRLPAPFAAAMRQMVGTLARGEAVVVVPLRAALSTQEAADLLGISRPTLVKLLDDGKIPSARPTGRHRRVRLADVLAYQAQQRQRRRQVLDEIARDSEEAGLYDIPTEDCLDTLRNVRGKR